MYQTPVIGYVIIQGQNPRDNDTARFVISHVPIFMSAFEDGMDDEPAPLWDTDKVIGILPAPPDTIALMCDNGNLIAIINPNLTLTDDTLKAIIEDYVADKGGRAELPIHIQEARSACDLIDPGRISRVIEQWKRDAGSGSIGGSIYYISFEGNTIIIIPDEINDCGSRGSECP